MWQYDYYGGDTSLIYYLDNNPIIQIDENIFKLHHLKRYVAQIVPKEEFSKERFSRYQTYEIKDNELTDDDLDVLKFKSLLKAKEFGWGVDITKS